MSESKAPRPTSEDDPVRILRARTHRADDLLEQAHGELKLVKDEAEMLGPAGKRFSNALGDMLPELRNLFTKPSFAADQFEQDHRTTLPEAPTAAQLIVNGGEVPEPDAHALGLLLDMVENGSSEALDFENDIARQAFVWLMRQHEPAVEQIRKLAEIAGVVNSDHIKWAGKRAS